MKQQKIAFLFPGQGAQYPGMGRDFYEQFPIAKKTFEEADALLNRPFSKLIFEGSSEELMLTKNSQIAIYITSIAILRVIQQEYPDLHPFVCAGLSLGEYTALTAAGKISFDKCLDLVQTRASAMHAACEQEKGTMQVVLGMTEESVAAALSTLDPSYPVWIANLNCPGQIVIAGSIEAMIRAADVLKEQGAKRILPLDVSGAFHSGLMCSAQEKLREKIQSVSFTESPTAVVMNVPGDFVSSSDQIRHFLIDQVASPVRWEKGIRKMMQEEITLYFEMGPGKTLSGMNKRIGVTEPMLSFEKVEDLHQMEVQCSC